MGSASIWHWLIVGAVVLIVFGGKGKISDIMGDVAKGINRSKRASRKKTKRQRFNTRVIRRCGPSIIKPPLTQTASLVKWSVR